MDPTNRPHDHGSPAREVQSAMEPSLGPRQPSGSRRGWIYRFTPLTDVQNVARILVDMHLRNSAQWNAAVQASRVIQARQPSRFTSLFPAPISNNYLGNRRLARNRSAPIVQNENCSLWMEHLPADVTHSEILGQIRNVGKIYQLHINAPNHNRTTRAAKITFFTRQSASAFYQATRGGFYVRPHSAPGASVEWNRVLVAEQVGRRALRSRVVVITGPTAFVNVHTIRGVLNSSNDYYYNIDRVYQRTHGATYRTIQLHFSSCRAEAEGAVALLHRAIAANGMMGCRMTYGTDPCA